MARGKTYDEKRSFDATPEPEGTTAGDVDPGRARPGKTFVIHQHHARRLHFDLRLEMMNGRTPVLVSWAVPKNLPIKTGKPHLAVHVEDHPFDYGSFSGTIPAGNYGAGEVRIFDRGTYEVLEQEPGKLSFRLNGDRMQGVWHLFKTSGPDEKDWMVRLRALERPDPDPLPQLEPMQATLVKDPFDDDRWIFEPKWDGVRTLAVCSFDETLLLSRRGNETTAIYPEFAKLHERLVCLDAIVDGEIVAMSGGRPSFERLQSRINLGNEREIARAMKAIPVTFIAFDVLYMDGSSLLSRPVEERKEILDELVVTSENVQVSPYVRGTGRALYDAACEQHLEGVVAKKLGGPYRPGRRGREWLKIKTVHDAELVIGGWSRGEGSRSSSFGALLVGSYDDDGLRYVGSVGTGFSEKTIEGLLPRLRDLEDTTCPFTIDPRKVGSGPFGKVVRDPHWVRPELVAKVEFRELTATGRLRAPSFKGLDNEKAPEDCLFSELVLLANG
ncbi:MAG: non-homologous end-joining DNA ligase [Actinomycetota bacterium]|nr:non-homologous end-joining DNA ligase [Actinomycetota bacterium]